MIKIKNLSISFKEKKVLKCINLNIPENSIFGFIGKNGAGKTTTMKAILGLLTPNSGEIIVNNEKVLFGAANTNKYIGYLPDVPEFYSFMTAYEFLYFCAELSKIKKEEIKPRVLEMLELVGLDKEKHQIKGFSRGMKQRLGIAQALLNKPKVLICDEPTSALDPIGRKEILDLLKSVSKETTILFSTHILSDVERICSDIALLDDGEIKLRGKLEDIKSMYSKEEYLLELDKKEDVNLLLENFSFVIKKEENKLSFYNLDNNLYTVLEFIAKNKISFVKLEKNEPTLESLFMEVTK